MIMTNPRGEIVGRSIIDCRSKRQWMLHGPVLDLDPCKLRPTTDDMEASKFVPARGRDTTR